MTIKALTCFKVVVMTRQIRSNVRHLSMTSSGVTLQAWDTVRHGTQLI